MSRQHFAVITGKRLAAQYFIVDANAQLTFSANMLFQWNNKALRQWYLAQGYTVGLGFRLRQMDAAVEIPDFVFSERRE